MQPMRTRISFYRTVLSALPSIVLMLAIGLLWVGCQHKSIAIHRENGWYPVTGDSNDEWEVADIPEWCEAIAKDRGKLILKVGKTKKAREGTLIVKSKGGKISSIILSQKKGGLF